MIYHWEVVIRKWITPISFEESAIASCINSSDVLSVMRSLRDQGIKFDHNETVSARKVYH